MSAGLAAGLGRTGGGGEEIARTSMRPIVTRTIGAVAPTGSDADDCSVDAGTRSRASSPPRSSCRWAWSAEPYVVRRALDEELSTTV